MEKVLDENEASQKRVLYVRRYCGPGFGEFAELFTYKGDEVYSIREDGIIVAPRNLPQMRVFFPWHVIVEFRYHQADAPARLAIQGF